MSQDTNDTTDPVEEVTDAIAGEGGAGAGLGIRFVARLLDALLIGIPASIVLGVLGLLESAMANVLFALLWFGYFVWFEANQGATVGKKLLKLDVSGSSGGRLSMEAAARRNIWMLLGLIPLLGGLLSLIAVIVIAYTIYSDSDNRGYHDNFAHAQVRRTAA